MVLGYRLSLLPWSHHHNGGDFYEAICDGLFAAPCCNDRMYMVHVGDALEVAVLGCHLEPPQPPVSAAVDFKKVFDFIELHSNNRMHIKVLSPFVDTASLLELARRSANAATVAVCARRRQQPPVRFEDFKFVWHEYWLDDPTSHAKFVAAVI